MECIHCKAYNPQASQLCSKCSKVLPASYNNYFEIFMMDACVMIDKAILDKEFYSKVKLMHPDLYKNNQDLEHKTAEEHYMLITKAYILLKNDITRVEYLLTLHGLDVKSQQQKNSVDQDLLIEMMELNEKLDECHDIKELNQLIGIKRMELNALLIKADMLYKSHENEALIEIYFEMKFIQRFIDRIKEAICKYMT